MVEVIKNKIRRRDIVARLLVFIVAISIFSYVGMVSNIVYTTSLRQDVELKTLKMEKNIESLEKEYVSLRAKVTEVVAKEKGFQNISSAKYISRQSLSALASVINTQ